MGAMTFPYLSTGMWMLAVALSVVPSIVAYQFYAHHWRRAKVLLKDGVDVADLAARKEQLQSDVIQLEKWIYEQKQHILQLDGERKLQETLRSELGHLEQQVAEREQGILDLRGEVGKLENTKFFLSQRNDQLTRENEDFERRNKELQGVEERLNLVQIGLEKLKDEFTQKKRDIEEATRGLAETEVRVDTLRVEQERLARDCEQLTARRVEMEREHVDAVQKLATSSGELSDRRAELAAAQEHLIDLKGHHAELDASVSRLEERRKSTEVDVERLNSLRDKAEREHVDAVQKLATSSGELSDRRAELAAAQEHLIDLKGHHAELDASVSRLEERRKSTEVDVERLNSLRDKAEREHVDAVQKLATSSGELSDRRAELAAAQEHLFDLKGRHAELDASVSRLEERRKAIKLDAERLNSLRDKAEREFGETSQRLENLVKELTSRREEAAKVLADLTRCQERQADMNAAVTHLEALRTTLEVEVERLKGERGGGKPEDKALDDLLKKPVPAMNRGVFGRESGGIDEYTMLSKLEGEMRDKGLVFSDRVVKAFHTSLKCHDVNPLTILAGVSGTGKTLLPCAYARIMGMHTLTLAVQPRWDSPQDMFGFYNYLERRYKATDLARALILMDTHNFTNGEFPELDGKRIQNRMLLVLLDEMNLARTEYYFSEFLSKLELRRQVKDPTKPEDRQQAEIELETGPGTNRRIRLWVGENVFFVGTMNEDETTQTLSDKVLDRANVLRFGRPSEQPSNLVAEAVDSSAEFLSLARWKKWIKRNDDVTKWMADKNIKNWTVKLNDALERIGRPFGYRVQNVIGSYVANYPGVDEGKTYKIAFADQVEQKLIPKLRGIDLLEEKSAMALDEIARIIDELEDDPLAEAYNEAKGDKSTGMFIWRGVSRRTEGN